MTALKRLRKIGLMECYHSTRHYLGLDSCVVSAAQYTTQDGLALTKEILFPALRTVIETHSALGLQLDGDEATTNVYLVRLPSIDLSQMVKFSDKENVQEAFEAQLVRRFETQSDLPLWRVEVLADNTVIFALHHTIGDGMSSMVFHLSLFKALQNARSGDSTSIVAVPTDTVPVPPIDSTTSLRPSLSTIASSIYKEFVPVAWTKAHLTWTGPASPSTPDLKTRIRLMTFSAADVVAFCAAARAHDATLTSTMYVVAITVLSRMLANDPAGYTHIAGGVAISLRGVAGIPEDAFCDYPSLWPGSPRVSSDFSWPEAARVAGTLRAQKREGREIIGMLRFLCGQFVPFMKAHLGAKRGVGFCVSNLGRVQTPELEGRWTIGRTMFAQCDVVVAAAFNINVCGDPTGGLNITFSWGETCIDAGFVEGFIADFQKEFQQVIAPK
ncbi:alcohol acetyltransferase [Mycena metata]|uniref:Alcohol acetyltransferase n=1 Tax=Mycena metata TaxID=1033252 RepID=A0AAD7NXC6_9AGAR|nr:alcohol acetyltransferase [Mycena metata]